ncbi:Hypothetical protein SRAE_2000005900 [Strongyloides ratti]|uniref:Uncharacterized protein n=1 Tax=Strongyloides ratti TaxID=34506 RepID=A0A090LB76_STRRB|nr:Hypothetical protein SRAE_2000005900 [Strongyloides ratti]CEF65378.1 Hypothetical protein SRAE_2000005900 [Strongyloides ratti]
MSIAFKGVEIIFGGVCFFVFYLYFSSIYSYKKNKNTNEKSISNGSEKKSLLVMQIPEYDSTRKPPSSDTTCTDIGFPVENGDSTYRCVESLPVDDENSQKISCRKDMLDKTPIQEY